MPKLTKAQRWELERRQIAKNRLRSDFCRAVLPRDAKIWLPREDEVRNAAMAETRTVEAAQKELRPLVFLMALQSEILRRRLAAEADENWKHRLKDFGNDYPTFLSKMAPRAKRGRRPDLWKHWLQPMNLRGYCWATRLGPTQIKKWLREIPDRDSHVEPPPKERGKGREKNYRWPVNREILSRWMLLAHFTPQQRRGWILSLLSMPDQTDDQLGDLLDFFEGSSALREAAGLGSPHTFETMLAEVSVQLEQAQAAKEKERSEWLKRNSLGFPFFGGLSDTSSAEA